MKLSEIVLNTTRTLFFWQVSEFQAPSVEFSKFVNEIFLNYFWNVALIYMLKIWTIKCIYYIKNRECMRFFLLSKFKKPVKEIGQQEVTNIRLNTFNFFIVKIQWFNLISIFINNANTSSEMSHLYEYTYLRWGKYFCMLIL